MGEGAWGCNVVGGEVAPLCPSGDGFTVDEGDVIGASAVRVSDRPGQSFAGVGLNRLQLASRNAEVITTM